jgi:hypothetical protein
LMLGSAALRFSRGAVGTSRRIPGPRNYPGRAARCICGGWFHRGSGTRSVR